MRTRDALVVVVAPPYFIDSHTHTSISLWLLTNMATQRDSSIEMLTAVSLGSSCSIARFSGFTPHQTLRDLAGPIGLCIAFTSKITEPAHLNVNDYVVFLDVTAVTGHLRSSHVGNIFSFLPQRTAYNLITFAI